MRTPVKNTNELLRRRIADLIRLLEQQRDGYEQLFAVLDARIAAMRCADWAAIGVNQQAHVTLAHKLAEREGLRRQLMDAIGVELQLGPRAGRKLTVSQLAVRLPSELSTDLTRAADGLRSILAKVAQANRVAGYVARGILDHLRWVFEAVTPQAESSGAYGFNGTPAAGHGAVLFEMTG